MYTGLKHLHILLIALFVISVLIKAILLLINEEKFDSYRKKTKVPEMIITMLFLVTGIIMIGIKGFGGLHYFFHIKLTAILVGIPLAVVGFKKKNKALSLLSAMIFVATIGLSLKAGSTMKEVHLNDLKSDPNYDKAMYAYEQLLKEPEATVPLRTASLLTLAQLNLVKERWDKGINLILQWMEEVETVTAQSYYLLASAYFQKTDYVRARSNMEEAIRLAEEEGYRPKENWYVLLAACFSELKDKKIISAQYALEQQVGIYEILEIDNELKAGVLSNLQQTELNAIAKKNGFRTMQDMGKDLLLSGDLSFAEFERVLQSN